MNKKPSSPRNIGSGSGATDHSGFLRRSAGFALSSLTGFLLLGLLIACSLPLDEVSYANTRGIPVDCDLDTWFSIPSTNEGSLTDINLSYQSEAGKYYSIEILTATGDPVNGLGIKVSSLAGSTRYLDTANAGRIYMFQPDGPVKIAIHSNNYVTGLQVRCRTIPVLEPGTPVGASTKRGCMDIYQVPFTGTLPVDYFVRDHLTSSDFTASTVVSMSNIDGTGFSADVEDYHPVAGCIVPSGGKTAFFLHIDSKNSQIYGNGNTVSYEVGFTNANPLPLGNDTWSDGSLKMGETLWYAYPSIAGENYKLDLDDSRAGSGTKTGKILVTTTSPGSPVLNFKNTDYSPSNTYHFAASFTGSTLVRVSNPYFSNGNASESYTHRIKVKKELTTGLTDNVWADSSISPGETQYFCIPVSKGEGYSVNWDDLNGNSSGGKTARILVSASNTDNSLPYFSENSSGYTSTQSIVPLSDGFIRLVVTADTAGTYAIRVKKRIPVDLTDNVWADSIIDYGEIHDFRIPVSADATYLVNWDDWSGHTSGEKTSYIVADARNADGSVIYFHNQNNGYFDTRIINTVTDGYIKISLRANGQPGSYSLRIRRLVPSSLSEGSWHQGSIAGYEIQSFTLSTDEGSIYTIKTNDAYSGDGSKTASIRLAATNNGTSLFNWRYGNYSSGLQFISTGGMTKIVVQAPDSSSAGTYSLVVSKPTIPVLADNVWTTGTITSDSQTQYFYVPFSGSGTCYVNWDDGFNGSGTYTLDVAVSAINGSTTFWTKIDSAYYLNATLTPGGPFWLKVEPYSSGSSGTFALRYRTTP